METPLAKPAGPDARNLRDFAQDRFLHAHRLFSVAYLSVRNRNDKSLDFLGPQESGLHLTHSLKVRINGRPPTRRTSASATGRPPCVAGAMTFPALG